MTVSFSTATLLQPPPSCLHSYSSTTTIAFKHDYSSHTHYHHHRKVRKMAQTIKQEPLDTYHDIGIPELVTALPSMRPRHKAPSGGRTTMSADQNSPDASLDGLPIGLVGRCFKTTVFISNGDSFVEVTRALIDTGAASIFVSQAAVTQLGASTHTCPPKVFYTADNTQLTYTKYVRLTLYLGGVGREVIAFVDEGTYSHHILLGIPAVELFDIKFEPNYGPRCEKLWHVAEKNNRRIRYVLEHCAFGGSLRSFDYQTGLRIANKRGKTPKEREAGMKIKRAKANYFRIHGKYQHKAGGA